MKEVKDCRLSINRIYGVALFRNIVRIQVEDFTAGTIACQIEVDLESFADCLMGRAMVQCASALFNETALLGTKQENKEELVPIEAYRPSDEEIQKALKPFEIDGWIGRESDLSNPHRAVIKENGKRYQRVVFFRNVPL